jgi:hypothetical protein
MEWLLIPKPSFFRGTFSPPEVPPVFDRERFEFRTTGSVRIPEGHHRLIRAAEISGSIADHSDRRRRIDVDHSHLRRLQKVLRMDKYGAHIRLKVVDFCVVEEESR